jgi:hypothetical protein
MITPLDWVPMMHHAKFLVVLALQLFEKSNIITKSRLITILECLVGDTFLKVTHIM